MSHMFGVTCKKLQAKQVKRIEKIALDNDAEFVYVGGSIPGNATTGWFETENLGHPHDTEVAKNVHKALEDAGIEIS